MEEKKLYKLLTMISHSLSSSDVTHVYSYVLMKAMVS